MKFLHIIFPILKRSVCLCLFILPYWGFAQSYYVIKGQIYDKTDKLTLPQAHVLLTDENGVGAVADVNGNYIISLQKPEAKLTFRFLGYDELIQTIKFEKGETTKILNIGLQPHLTQLGAVQIQGNRYKTDTKTAIQTMEVLGLEDLNRTNATTLDRALDNVAGLAIVDNEPQMRGGSGYSSGMGSRVMLLLDEMPILRADAGRPSWNLIPMEDVSQIEILKGASSVLFGSAAINGAINVRSAYAKNEPETKIQIFTGIYSRTKDKSICGWSQGAPLTYGANLSHSRKIKKKLDFTLGVSFESNDGYRGGDTVPDPNRKVEHQETRVRANVGTQYRINDRWTVSLNANFMYSDNKMYNFWFNADKGLYHAFPNTLSNFNDLVFFIDPHVKYIHPKGGIHTLDNRFMYSNNKVTNIPNQDAYSRTVYNAYQYRKTFKKAGDLSLSAGASNQYAYSFGEVFSGDMTNFGRGQHSADNFAIFAKLEKQFLKQKNLGIELGGRWELCMVDRWSENKPVFQLGLNYEIVKSHTFFRASLGQGYRAATIGEKFITTQVGLYGFYPNPDLKSERSLSVEAGIKQLFKAGAVEGFVDVAGFHQVYNNYIEFFMGPWNTNAVNTIEQFGFKFFNTGRATISGAEATLALQADIAKILEIQFQGNYTYSLPLCREPDFSYTTIRKGKPDEYNYTYMNSAAKTKGYILKYRIQHMAKLDLNLTFVKKFTIGFGVQYLSAMQNVDKMFISYDKKAPNAPAYLALLELPFEGTYNFMEENKNGSWVFDLRLSVNFPHLSIALITNNLLNKTYSLRPMCIEAPRLTTLQITYRFIDIDPLSWFKRNRADVSQL
ncbi:MAG: TonB-dependent receptor [Bacteroidales bacterium]